MAGKSKVSSADNQQRALLSVLKNKYKKKTITQSYLLLMVSLQGNSKLLDFIVTFNQSAQTVIENRLKISDKFCVQDWMFAVMNVAMAGATPTAPEISAGIPSTFPNANTFTAAIALLLQSLWNGQMSVTINNDVYYDSFPVRNFYRVPTSAAGTAVSAVATTGVLNFDGWDSFNFGFAPVYPTFELDGMGNNEIQLTLPTPTVTTAAAGRANYACLYMRGYKIQNVNQTTGG